MSLLFIVVMSTGAIPGDRASPLEKAHQEIVSRSQWVTYHIIMKGTIYRYDNQTLTMTRPFQFEQVADCATKSTFHFTDWPSIDQVQPPSAKSTAPAELYDPVSGIVIEKPGEIVYYSKQRNAIEIYQSIEQITSPFRRVDLRLIGGFTGWDTPFRGLGTVETNLRYFDKLLKHDLPFENGKYVLYHQQKAAGSAKAPAEATLFRLDSEGYIAERDHVFDYPLNKEYYQKGSFTLRKVHNNTLPISLQYDVYYGASLRYHITAHLEWKSINGAIDSSYFRDSVIARYAKEYRMYDNRLKKSVVIENPHSKHAVSVPLEPSPLGWSTLSYVSLCLAICALGGTIVILSKLMKKRPLVAKS